MNSRPPSLPAVLAEIADVAGFDAAWALARAKGGQSIFIPASVVEGHWLAELVGFEAANAICAHFSAGGRGDNILVPMASAARRAEAWAEALASGKSVNATAAELGVHRRTVLRHRAKSKDQGDLF